MEEKDELPEIPALTMSGGVLKQPEFALEFRIWLHNRGGGDDTYVRCDTLKLAKECRKEFLKNKSYAIVEQILAVVWDNSKHRFREARIEGLKYEK